MNRMYYTTFCKLLTVFTHALIDDCRTAKDVGKEANELLMLSRNIAKAIYCERTMI